MSNLAGPPKVPTIRELAAELARLRDGAEDLEDARELDAAIQRNGDNPPSLDLGRGQERHRPVEP